MSVAPHRVSVLSLEHVYSRVDFREAGEIVDPTADAVSMAFKETGDPAPADFKTAEWAPPDLTGSEPVYAARCLVGPGGAVTLTAGAWWVWVKIVDAPEIPVIRAGKVVAY